MAELEDSVPEAVKELHGAPDQKPTVVNGGSGRLDFGLVLSSPRPLPPAPAKNEPIPEDNAALTGTYAGEVREFGALKIKMCWCPPGSFKMGSLGGDTEADDKEKPKVGVTLSRGFWLGQTEVTQGQWTSVMRSRSWSGYAIVKEGANYPAVYVSHGLDESGNVEPDSATAYCRLLTQQERQARRLPAGWKYRLPSEAEWEYACRAGTTSRYGYDGDSADQLGQYAWFNLKQSNEPYAHLVGQKRANAWKLHNMHGNVGEWCQDWYAAELPGGQDPLVTAGSSDRINRGGSWIGTARGCRSAYRNRNALLARHTGLGSPSRRCFRT